MININLKNFSISNNSPFVLIAGPCVIENESHSLMIAEKLHKTCDNVGINLFLNLVLIKQIDQVLKVIEVLSLMML